MIVAQTKIRVIILKYCDICLIFVIPYFCSLNSEEKEEEEEKVFRHFL